MTDTRMDKSKRRATHEAKVAAFRTPPPSGCYDVVYADPPWRFEPYSRITGMDRSADNHYATSPLDSVKTLDIASIAARDSVLFLWAMAPMLPQALEVMASWGFSCKASFAWVKDKIGLGYWVRNQHETLLLGVRGSPPTPSAPWPSVICAPCTAHSQKPDAVYQLVEAVFP